MKRLFDVAVAAGLLLCALPLLVVAALAIRSRLGGPVLYVQQRPGLGERPFQMVKFRTMTDDRDRNGVLLEDEKRMTKLGAFLRASSIDELPELWNVLVGEMSLVGPRPLLMEYLPLYNAEQARRHDVKPGITGWAQVNGRNALTWPEKLRLDVWYVDNQSFRVDMNILLRTIRQVLLGRDISHEGHTTMEKFRGES